MKRYALSLLLSPLWASSLFAAGAATSDKFDRARIEIREVMAYHNVPSVAIAVAQNGKIIWEEGFGWADIEKHIPTTPHTAYLLASISKPVTATALMILVERGQVDLDKPMNDYLGAQKLVARVGNARDATVRRIADHTAGLPPHAGFFYEDEPVPRPPMDETIRRYGVLVAPPGEVFTYSNLDYGLLEYAIERISGRSYAEFVRDEVFVPLGLNESAVNRMPDLGDRVASRYWFGYHKVPFYDVDARGAGAVFMSAHDLVRFGIFHLQGHLDAHHGSVLKPESLRSMREAASLNSGEKNNDYGLGWQMGEKHGLKWFGHGGGSAGTATMLSVYPDADLVVVVLGNGVSETGAIHFLENDIVHAVLPDTIRHDHGFKPPTDLVGKWEGSVDTYAGKTAVAFDFRENGSVLVRLASAPAQEVVSVTLDQKTSVLSLDKIRGDMGTPDAAKHPYKVQFSLKLRPPGTLNGSACTNSFESLPDRMGDLLCNWVELHRSKVSAW